MLTNLKPKPQPFHSLLVLFGVTLIRRREAWFGICVTPVINAVLFFFVFSHAPHVKIEPSFFASYLLMATMGPSFISLGTQLARWKRTAMLKRIGNHVRVLRLLGAAILIYVTVGLVASLWMFGWLVLLIALQPPPNLTLSQLLTSARQWWWIMLGIGLTLIIGCALSVMIVGCLKNSKTAEGIVIIVFFLTLLLGGMMFPITVIDQYPFLFIVSLLLPFKFCLYMTNSGFGQSPIKSGGWSTQASNMLISHPWISLLCAIIVLVGFIALAVHYFNWGSKL